jgi:hypothetical protein
MHTDEFRGKRDSRRRIRHGAAATTWAIAGLDSTNSLR